jgi:hypothetical protein
MFKNLNRLSVLINSLLKNSILDQIFNQTQKKILTLDKLKK